MVGVGDWASLSENEGWGTSNKKRSDIILKRTKASSIMGGPGVPLSLLVDSQLAS